MSTKTRCWCLVEANKDGKRWERDNTARKRSAHKRHSNNNHSRHCPLVFKTVLVEDGIFAHISACGDCSVSSRCHFVECVCVWDFCPTSHLWLSPGRLFNLISHQSSMAPLSWLSLSFSMSSSRPSTQISPWIPVVFFLFNQGRTNNFGCRDFEIFTSKVSFIPWTLSSVADHFFHTLWEKRNLS